MKVCLFTGNQPRHLALVEALCQAGHDVRVVYEVSTVRPGERPDLFAEGTALARYFSLVRAVESQSFGPVRALPSATLSMAVRLGDLSRLGPDELAPLLDRVELFLLFGCSYITGWLADWLIERNAVAVHMGLAPWYRGNSANFWALYDRRPELVGATLYRIDHRIEAGPIVFHALPAPCSDPFLLGMQAVRSMIDALIQRLEALPWHPAEAQDGTLCLRQSRRADFTETRAREFLDRPQHMAEIVSAFSNRPASRLIWPFFLPG